MGFDAPRFQFQAERVRCRSRDRHRASEGSCRASAGGSSWGQKALDRRVALDQRAVHAEVIVARQHGVEERRRQAMRVQPRAIVSERRRVKRRIVGRHPQKPAKQQVRIDPLDQLSLAADRVERHQQERFEQPLRRYAGPARRTVSRRERVAQTSQNTRRPFGAAHAEDGRIGSETPRRS